MPALPTHLDILLARHEDEDVSRSTRQVDLQGLFHCSLHIILLWGLNSTAQVNLDQYPYLLCPMSCPLAHHSHSYPVLCVPLRVQHT